MLFGFKPALAVGFYATVAIAAVNRSAFTRLKWNFRVFATLGAYRGEHLTPRPRAEAATVSVALRLPGFAT